jgi:hypothetical protein
MIPQIKNETLRSKRRSKMMRDIRYKLIFTIVLITTSLFTATSAFAFKYTQVKTASQDASSSLNIYSGSIFRIYIEPGTDPIDEFERVPFIYITKEEENKEGMANGLTRKIKIRILDRDGNYPTGKLEFPCQSLACEWKERLSPGMYSLWVQPRNNGKYYEPCKVEALFILNTPVIQDVTEFEGEDAKLTYIKITGLYFSTTPNLYVFFTVIKDGVGKKIRQKCKLERKKINIATGTGEAVFSFRKRADTKYTLGDENGEPLIEISNK